MSTPTTYPYGFDPAYGMAREALEAMLPPASPPDFDEFWTRRYARAVAGDPQPRLTSPRDADTRWRVHDLTYISTDGFPIGGWLLQPREGRVTRGLVVGHGYGGRDAPDLDLPVTETAILFPCFRGLSRSSRAPISTDPAWHVLHDIDRRDRYILGGCVEDLWVAVSVLASLFPDIDGFGYSGISFGGGVGALAIAFDSRIKRAHLTVPTFGNMPVWLSLPTIGSGNAVQSYRRSHPEVIDTLSYFDAATAATRITQPTLVAVARFDPAVAPPCQFSIANGLTSSKHHESFILDAGHVDYPGMREQHARLSTQMGCFFGAVCDATIDAGTAPGSAGTWNSSSSGMAAQRS